MFDSYYEFTIPEDEFYRVDKYTPATQNREHKHKDVQEGLDKYTANWEILATNDERRRGSDTLYLVNDAHYIWCSRTGMESAGNTIQMSQSTPDDLRYTILSTVFEEVSRRKFGEIKQGIDSNTFDSKTLSIASPRQLILAKELSESEQQAYYDELANLTTELLSRYYETETVDDLKEIITWYDTQRKELFREYTNFTPSTVSQVINSTEERNGWRVPNKIDAGKRLTVVLHKNVDYGESDDTIRTLIISLDSEKIELIEEVNGNDTILKSKSHSSVEELQRYFDGFMEYTPQNLPE